MINYPVGKCAEFVCPFFHAGIMGSEECGLVPFDRRGDKKYDLHKHNGKAPPRWCPLRKGDVLVSLNVKRGK
jgi:hypothetical protein